MEVITASNLSSFKLFLIPTHPANTTPTLLASWKPESSLFAKDGHEFPPITATRSLLSIDDQQLISSHSLDHAEGSVFLLHQLHFSPSSSLPDPASPDHLSPSFSHNTPDTSSCPTPSPIIPTQNVSVTLHPLHLLTTSSSVSVSLHYLHHQKTILHASQNGDLFLFDPHLLDPSNVPSTPIITTWNLQQSLTSCSPSPDQSLLSVVGPKGTLLTVYDLQSQKQYWKSKSPPHDSLDMPSPIWDLDSNWIDQNLIVAVTSYGHIRIYDIRTKRQPIFSYSLTDERASYLSYLKHQRLTKQDHVDSLQRVVLSPFDHTQAVISTNRGDVMLVDIDHTKNLKKRVIKRLKGITASVQDVKYCPHEPNNLVLTGFDRYLRIYDSKMYNSLSNVYTKLIQNRICFSNVVPMCFKVSEARKDAKENLIHEKDNEYDAIWENLPVSNKKSKVNK
ncbi:uncharacterized protein LOC126328214 [Schistocerca gregaria]|uniref:uncharacterized protein LOC126328214 n=1 Tax=Schistocerca gregaria TaxID=7010 RepID=UPI00211E3B77|nr:uncharacterized protein LOC126328214 [Schistocerca gregaria]